MEATHTWKVEKGQLVLYVNDRRLGVLEPTYKDGFTRGGTVIDVQRDAKGRITGFVRRGGAGAAPPVHAGAMRLFLVVPPFRTEAKPCPLMIVSMLPRSSMNMRPDRRDRRETIPRPTPRSGGRSRAACKRRHRRAIPAAGGQQTGGVSRTRLDLPGGTVLPSLPDAPLDPEGDGLERARR